MKLHKQIRVEANVAKALHTVRRVICEALNIPENKLSLTHVIVMLAEFAWIGAFYEHRSDIRKIAEYILQNAKDYYKDVREILEDGCIEKIEELIDKYKQ